MANNRMYLVNKRTGTRIYVAMYYPSTGWYSVLERTQMDEAFDDADFGHLTEEQRAANSLAPVSLDAPFRSGAGMWGDEWTLEYEQTSEGWPPAAEARGEQG